MKRVLGWVIVVALVTGCTAAGSDLPAATAVPTEAATPTPRPTPLPTIPPTPSPSPEPTPFISEACVTTFAPLARSLEGLVTWLDEGGTLGEYSKEVDKASAAYDLAFAAIPDPATMEPDELLAWTACISAVGTPAENALNAYVEAYNAWEADADDDATIQAHWDTGGELVLEVLEALGPLPEPTPAPAVSYKKLTDRSWKQLVKSPDSYSGNGYQVWGCIFQFDSATGDDQFLANASYKKLTYWNLDGELAVFSGEAAALADFVEGDLVLMNAISTGSLSYETAAGGNSTVPSFDVTKITRKGTCD